MHRKSKPEDRSASDGMRPLDREKELELMVQIVAGLLANGHFTYNDDGQAGVLVQPEEEYQWDIQMLYVIDENLKQPGIRGMAPLAAASDLGASFLD